MPKLTDEVIRKLPAPAKFNRIYYDDELKGFGARVTAKGARAFILNYRTRQGRERRYTIGDCSRWTARAAREEAKTLKLRIDRGEDPLDKLQQGRDAKRVKDLCERFVDEHFEKLRPGTRRDYDGLLQRDILPALKNKTVAEVSYNDIEAIHRKITKRGSPYQANRTVALLSKMFALAERWQWCTDNPTRGIERNQETKRNRYLSGEELGQLTLALSKHEDQQAANIIRLMLLTGARKGEVMNAEWDQIDLSVGIWIKPGATTKQKTEHRIPLSAPARQLLAELRSGSDTHKRFVFPGRYGVGPRADIKKNWKQLCRSAQLQDVRMHDLRHTYASILASAGLSLPVIGALLGHTQPATTSRYAHLFDDPLRAATERAAAIVTGEEKPKAGVIKLKGY